MLRFFLVLTLFGGLAHAQVFNGAISAATGGTGRAGVDGSESVFLNPALVTIQKGYQATASYRDGELLSGDHTQALAIGAVDNTKGVLFPGSLHYVRLRQTGLMPHPVNGELWHVSGGWKPLDQLAAGVSVYNLNDQVLEGSRYSQWNGSLGFLWMVDPHFGMAYVLDNLAQASSSIPDDLRQKMRQALGFYGVLDGVLRMRLDVARDEQDNPHKRLVYMAGIESLTSEFMVVRLGYRLDDENDQRVWTAGLGFNGPRLKIDYSFEKAQGAGSEALHSVDMRLTF